MAQCPKEATRAHARGGPSTSLQTSEATAAASTSAVWSSACCTWWVCSPCEESAHVLLASANAVCEKALGLPEGLVQLLYKCELRRLWH